MELTSKQLAGMIDHTNLKAFATTDDLTKLCREAAEYGFKSVAINSYYVKLCRKLLEGTGVLTGATISFPLGQMTVDMKAAEVMDAVKNGCQEFDYVLNVAKVKEHDYDYIEREMAAMVGTARRRGVACKVIFETCYLTDDEIIETAKVAARVRPDFVKTSTGFGTAGATVEHVRLMKKYAGDDVLVKAAGGIRTLADAMAMIDAGASRIGTSAGVKIINELNGTLF